MLKLFYRNLMTESFVVVLGTQQKLLPPPCSQMTKVDMVDIVNMLFMLVMVELSRLEGSHGKSNERTLFIIKFNSHGNTTDF